MAYVSTIRDDGYKLFLLPGVLSSTSTANYRNSALWMKKLIRSKHREHIILEVVDLTTFRPRPHFVNC